MTSLLLMRIWRVTDQTWDGWPYHCFCKSERKVLTHLVHPFPTRVQASRIRWREVTPKENQVEIQVVCMVPNWKKKRFYLNKEILINSSSGKLIKSFKENAQLRQSYLKRSLKLDRREWKMQNGDRALHETGSELQSPFSVK